MQFKKAESLVITTTKPDKWDRYLAEVFVRQHKGEELYLNNFVLAEGRSLNHATKLPSDHAPRTKKKDGKRNKR